MNNYKLFKQDDNHNINLRFSFTHKQVLMIIRKFHFTSGFNSSIPYLNIFLLHKFTIYYQTRYKLIVNSYSLQREI